MDRVEQNAVGDELRETWTDRETGALLDPGTVTIGISRADGTVLVAAGTPTAGSGAAARVFPLTLAHTALLDTLTVTWTSSVYGSRTPKTVEIVGGFLFSVAEARAIGLSDTQYSGAQIVGMRLLVEQKLERICGRAFVPRYALESVPASQPLLRFPDVRSIRSVTRDGTPLSPTADYAWISGGLGYVKSMWGPDLIVGYEYGLANVEEPVRSAALQEAKQSLTVGASGSDPRIVSFTTDDGSVRYTDVSQGAGFFSQDANWVASNYDMSVSVA